MTSASSLMKASIGKRTTLLEEYSSDGALCDAAISVVNERERTRELECVPGVLGTGQTPSRARLY